MELEEGDNGKATHIIDMERILCDEVIETLQELCFVQNRLVVTENELHEAVVRSFGDDTIEGNEIAHALCIWYFGTRRPMLAWFPHFVQIVNLKSAEKDDEAVEEKDDEEGNALDIAQQNKDSIAR